MYFGFKALYLASFPQPLVLSKPCWLARCEPFCKNKQKHTALKKQVGMRKIPTMRSFVAGQSPQVTSLSSRILLICRLLTQFTCHHSHVQRYLGTCVIRFLAKRSCRNCFTSRPADKHVMNALRTYFSTTRKIFYQKKLKGWSTSFITRIQTLSL